MPRSRRGKDTHPSVEMREASSANAPGMVAISVVPLQQSLGCGADFLGSPQRFRRSPGPEFPQSPQRPLYRFLPHGLIVLAAPIHGNVA